MTVCPCLASQSEAAILTNSVLIGRLAIGALPSTKAGRSLGMGRTWQSFGKICLPCGRNLSSGDIAKCDPNFSGWKKTLRNRKTSKMPKCLGGAGRFWKTRAKQ